ncbi:hypothetical protein KC960_04050 [Candidatus Saccharibacteria bacterium]|nr:hypothetical protein [Candidatus Saccharibacteria bacterium]
MSSVCKHCSYEGLLESEFLKRGDDTPFIELGSHLIETPCDFVKTGRCAVADFAVSKVFIKSTLEG